MKKLFISEKTPNKIKSMLCAMGFFPILLPPDKSLPVPVSSHADMLIFNDGKRYITTRSYFENNPDLFDGIDIALTEACFGNEYPKDIILNAFVFNDELFGLIDSLSTELCSLYQYHVNVRQGYARCSTLLFGNNAITSDTSIISALSDKGCNVLPISAGHIALPGYDHGFIGGASFAHNKDIIFFGDITEHPDYADIAEFITKQGYDYFYEKDTPLIDLGGAVPINNACR